MQIGCQILDMLINTHVAKGPESTVRLFITRIFYLQKVFRKFE